MIRRKVHLGAAVLALLLATLACAVFDSGPPRVENARLASDEKGEKTATTFGQNDTFYIVGDLKGAPQEIPVKAVWTAVQADSLEANTVVTETLGTMKSGPFNFSLYREEGYWPAGQFKADLYLNDQVAQSFGFQVERTIPTAFKDVRLARDEDGQQPATSYGQKDTFYLVGELVSAPDDTPAKAVWTAVDTGETVHEDEAKLSSGKFYFSLFREQGYWPAGAYKADLYLNGELKETRPFQVERTLPAVLSGVQMALDQEGAQPTTVFSPGDTFYVTANLENAPPEGATVKAVWTGVKLAGSAQENQVISTFEQALPDGPIWISLVSDSGTWPSGEYQVDLFVDGGPVETLPFEVSGPAVENVFLARDKQGDEPTSVFTPQQDFNIVGDLANAPQGAQVHAIWKVVAAEGLNPGDQINEGKIFDFQEGSFSITLERGATTWQPGEYQVDLLVNGTVADSLTFLVTTARLDNLALSRDENGRQPTKEYGAQDIFYLVFDVVNARQEINVKTTWKRLGEKVEDDQTLNEEEYTFPNGGYYISLKSDSGSWTPGSYLVNLYVNGYYYATRTFDVK